MIKQIIFILKDAYSFQNFKIIKINWKMIIKYPSKLKLKPDLWNSKMSFFFRILSSQREFLLEKDIYPIRS